MSEGLDPIEAGKQLHDSRKKAAERSDEKGTEEHQDNGDGGRRGWSAERHSRILQVCEAVLLALVTVTAAWAGYSAARWSTTSRVDIAEANSLGNLASRDALSATSLRNFDSSTFEAWFTAYTLGSPQKELVAIRRFRPQFLVAFNAWMATDPLTNPNAPPGPTYMPEYKLPEQTQADALDSEDTSKLQAGSHAGQVSDDYVRITVFLAAVLFLVGIGSSFQLHYIRYALVVFGSALLIISVVLILQQPGLPS